jgi:hypothetical protein
MGPLFVVLLQPAIQVGVQFLQRPIEFSSGTPRDRTRSAWFCETVRKSRSSADAGSSSGLIDILDGQVQFVHMALRCPAVLSPSIREDPVQRNLGSFEEWQRRGHGGCHWMQIAGKRINGG